MLIGVGDLARHYDPDYWFESSDACAQGIETLLRFDDCLLVKGSFAVQMERVVNELLRIGENRSFT